MSEKCENCKFWKREDDHGGKCRRYPEQLVSYEREVQAFHPFTGADDWCGEWKPHAVH